MKMTQEEFDRERSYQVVMHFVRKMLSEGLISEEEYCQIDRRNRRNFLPITGDLFSGRTLFYAKNRANMVARKWA